MTPKHNWKNYLHYTVITPNNFYLNTKITPICHLNYFFPRPQLHQNNTEIIIFHWHWFYTSISLNFRSYNYHKCTPITPKYFHWTHQIYTIISPVLIFSETTFTPKKHPSMTTQKYLYYTTMTPKIHQKSTHITPI